MGGKGREEEDEFRDFGEDEEDVEIEDNGEDEINDEDLKMY
jgi:hypothetical protein